MSGIRPVSIAVNVNMHAEGSALIKMGNTHVLCTASVESKVPEWLREKNQGWITAEYAMLPRATSTRSRRERVKTPSRSLEISRLVGRALRASTDLGVLGPQMITVDCDVLQADGGTRTAAITGGMVALTLALRRLQKARMIARNPVVSPVAAVSVGIVDGKPAVDLDYDADHRADLDMNVAMNAKGQFIEIQGSAERSPFSREQLNALLGLAATGIRKLFAAQRKALSGGK